MEFFFFFIVYTRIEACVHFIDVLGILLKELFRRYMFYSLIMDDLT